MGGSVSKRNSEELITGRDEKRAHIMPRDPAGPPGPPVGVGVAGGASGGAPEKLVQTVFRWEHGGSKVCVFSPVLAPPGSS